LDLRALIGRSTAINSDQRDQQWEIKGFGRWWGSAARVGDGRQREQQKG